MALTQTRDHHFSATEPLNVKLSQCLINWRWQLNHLGGWHHRHWDPGPHSKYKEAAAAGCGFHNKDADEIAEMFGLEHLEPTVKYEFVLRLSMFFEPWIP